MIANLKPYRAIEDSGVPWLGHVPSHWRLERAKWLVRKMDRPVRDADEVVTCFRDGTVTLRKNRRVRGFTESLKEIGYQGVRCGDLVIHAMDAFAGAIGVADSDGKCTPVYSVCEPTSAANAQYYAYTVREMARSQWIQALAKGIRERSTDFRFEAFGSQQVPLPPIPEQAAIVRFLDHADRRIRRYIRAKQNLIELLEEQRDAIVYSAVTRGLDPSVRLKPSGVDWLGAVPEHWEVRKLRQCGAVVGGMTPSMEIRHFWDGLIPWVTPKDMKRPDIADSSLRVTEAAVQETSLRLIDPPAVLLVVRGMILARRVPVAWTTAPVTINQDMKALKPHQGVNAEFLAHSLRSAQEAFVPLIDEAGHGTRRLPTERWRDLGVAMPPEDEQATIVRFIDEETTKVRTAIERAQDEVSLIRELRTRLITDVVTGKLDVREVAAQLPDGVEEPEPLDEAEGLTDVEEDEDVESGPEEVEA